MADNKKMTRAELLRLWELRYDAGNKEGAAEIRALLDQEAQPVAVETTVAPSVETPATIVEEVRPAASYDDIPSVPTGEPIDQPPPTETNMGEKILEVLYPGRSTQYVKDLYTTDIKEELQADWDYLKEGTVEMVTDRDNWRLAGEMGGWIAASPLILAPEPVTTAAGMAAAPILAASGAGIMTSLYDEFLGEGIDLNNVGSDVRSALLWNTVFTGLPTMATAVKDTAARFITGTMGQRVGREAAQAKAWLDDVWQRWKMVGGAPDPSASGQSDIIRATKAFGRVPFLGNFYVWRQRSNVKKSLDWYATQLEEVAPLVSASEVGKMFTRDATSMGKWMLQSLDSLYTNARNLAKPLDEKMGGIVPTQSLKEFAAKLAGRGAKLPETKPRYMMTDEGPVLIEEAGELAKMAPDQWERWVINNFGKLQNFTTVEQIQNLKHYLSEQIRLAGAPGSGADVGKTQVLRDALMATNQAMLDMATHLKSLGSKEGTEVANAFKFADEQFGWVMNVMESPAGQSFHAFDRAFWNRATLMTNWSKQGSQYSDTMFETALNTNSMQWLKDLRILVGDKAYAAARRRYLEDAWLKAFQPQTSGDSIFSRKVFEDAMKLSTGSSEVAEELFRGSKVGKKELQNFLLNLGDYQISFNYAAMLLRKVGIGGARSIVRGLSGVGALGVGAGAAVGAGGWMPWTLVGAFMIRAAGQLFTSPWAFKQLSEFARAERRFYEGQISKRMYAAAIDKAIRYFGYPGDGEAEDQRENVMVEQIRAQDLRLREAYPILNKLNPPGG